MPLIEAKSLKKQVLISCNNKKLQNIPAVHLQSYFGVGCSGGMGKANFIKWIKADFREWSKADSTYATSQLTLFIVSGSPSNAILGEVT